jgi:hypothetical protein
MASVFPYTADKEAPCINATKCRRTPEGGEVRNKPMLLARTFVPGV